MKATKAPRVIISGGGTGGHIYPALAIAQEVRARAPQADILFVGARGRMEMEKVPAAGFPIEGLPISGLQRRLTAANLSFPFKVLDSLRRADRLVRTFRPDVAVGVGGYASGPTLLAASLRGVPTLLQEQNSYAGLTNKWLARRARRICVAYEGMEAYFPAERIHLTGNPVRQDLLDVAEKRAEGLSHFGLAANRPVLMVMGGSLGARSLNEGVAAALPQLTAAGYQVLWQTGKAYYERTAAQGGPLAPAVHTTAFIQRMDLAYAAADVVVSRAGALSISELCLVGKPVVLVPSPNVAEDHQTKNAARLVERDAAVLLPDADAPTRLFEVADALLSAPARRQALGRRIRELARPHATRDIADEVFELIGS